ncbi:MAG: hypothetical protein JWP38_3170 [Herbaspirillum sp.]|nr:hypothetical protein [Herbaspirillum sp.]
MNHPKSASGGDPFADTLNDMPGIACGQAFIAEQGAQILSWRDSAGRERLYLSRETGGMTRGARADGDNAQAIRGGIPICFPQFSGRGTLQKHGIVRTIPWQPAGRSETPGDGGKCVVALTCGDDARTLAVWPRNFAATLRAEVADDSLLVSLSVINTGSAPWEFTAALHSYLQVDDVRNMRLRGLQGVSYQDATADNVVVAQQAQDLTVDSELDRVYLSPPKTLTLLEPGVPSLQIEQQGFEDSVIWNPGPLKAAALADFPDADWLRMVCVEAACVAVPVRLEPGQSWTGSQKLSVVR